MICTEQFLYYICKYFCHSQSTCLQKKKSSSDSSSSNFPNSLKEITRAPAHMEKVRSALKKHLKNRLSPLLSQVLGSYHPVTPPMTSCVVTEYFSAMGPELLPNTLLHHWCLRAYSVRSTTSYTSSSLSGSSWPTVMQREIGVGVGLEVGHNTLIRD